MSRPKLLDLFCCEGGASMGYYRAGFDVYGIDLFADYSRKRYPFPARALDVFHALRLLRPDHLGRGLVFYAAEPSVRGEMLLLSDFDAVVASPPCQRYSITSRMTRATREPMDSRQECLSDRDLIGAVADSLGGAA